MDELNKLDYTFIKLPILIGGAAMEHYGMRQTGHDVDFIISKQDALELLKLGKELNTFGGTEFDDDGFSTDMDSTFTNIDGLELDLAVTMFMYTYDYFLTNAEEMEGYRVVSRENLLLMKCLAASNNMGWQNKAKMISKQRRDMDLIVNSIVEHKYGQKYDAISFNTPYDGIIDNVTLEICTPKDCVTLDIQFKPNEHVFKIYIHLMNPNKLVKQKDRVVLSYSKNKIWFKLNENMLFKDFIENADRMENGHIRLLCQTKQKRRDNTSPDGKTSVRF